MTERTTNRPRTNRSICWPPMRYQRAMSIHGLKIATYVRSFVHKATELLLPSSDPLEPTFPCWRLSVALLKGSVSHLRTPPPPSPVHQGRCLSQESKRRSLLLLFCLKCRIIRKKKKEGEETSPWCHPGSRCCYCCCFCYCSHATYFVASFGGTLTPCRLFPSVLHDYFSFRFTFRQSSVNRSHSRWWAHPTARQRTGQLEVQQQTSATARGGRSPVMPSCRAASSRAVLLVKSENHHDYYSSSLLLLFRNDANLS